MVNKKYDYEAIAVTALGQLSNESLIEVLQSAIKYKSIREALLEEEPELWEPEKSVESKVGHVARNAQEHLEKKDRVKPLEWMARDLAARIRAADLLQRTSVDASGPLRRLIGQAGEADGPANTWPDGVEAAARETFRRALTSTDDDGLGRATLLRFRFLESSEMSREERARVVEQLDDYRRLWEEVLSAYGRRMVEGVELNHVLESLGALEDGYLARAIGETRPSQQRLSAAFGKAVVAVITGSTEQVDPDGGLN